MRIRFLNLIVTGVLLSLTSFSGLVQAYDDSLSFESQLKLQTKTIVSDWVSLQEFTGLVLDVDVHQSADDTAIGMIRFEESDGDVSDWVTINNDYDAHYLPNQNHAVTTGVISNLINTNPSKKFQIKYDILSGADTVLPKIRVVNYQGIYPKGEDLVVNNIQKVASLTDLGSGLNIISRESWGAQDSYNYVEEYTDEDYEAIEKFKENPYVEDVVIEKDGHLLAWPMQYSNDIKFLAVHHTATVENLDNPRQAIRNIQYYHAIVRGWGDIGYHYVIDQQGNIYEGRDGGKNIIGGHSTEINKVSVGIALLGNFQEKEPTEATLKALTKLLSALADEYNLDVNDYDSYEGVRYPVLGGHRDYSATACPGIYGRKFLPVLRGLVNAEMENDDSLEIYEVSSLGATIDLARTISTNIEPEIKNTSDKTWAASDTYLKITSGDSKVVPADMKISLKSDTLNNKVGTFSAKLFGNGSDGYYTIKADLYSGGRKINNEDIVLSLYVKPEAKVEVIEEISDEGGKEQTSFGIKSPYSIFYKNRYETDEETNTNSDTGSGSSSGGITSGNINVTNNSSVDVNDPAIKVLISKFNLNLTNVVSSSDVDLVVDGKVVKNDFQENITVWKSSQGVKAGVGYDIWEGESVRIVPSGDRDKNVSEIVDYENRPSWNTELNDNKFRGILEFFVNESGEMQVMNELGIESYLIGLAEVPDSEPEEKAKTIVVAARSYAYYYSNGHGKGLKFKGKPYHLDDSPERSQKYLGYGFEERNTLTKKVVAATTGKVVTWYGYDVVIPYFSQSDGRTRTPKEVWGWSYFKTPYLTSVNDNFCMNGNGQLLGHGVGISGCGATEMAKQGYTYEEIIDYYLKGVEITKRY